MIARIAAVLVGRLPYEGFSLIVAPLTQLTRKNKKFAWGEEQDKSFLEVKTKLTSAHVLIVPSGTERFVIYSDASKLGLGCVLMHRQ